MCIPVKLWRNDNAYNFDFAYTYVTTLLMGITCGMYTHVFRNSCQELIKLINSCATARLMFVFSEAALLLYFNRADNLFENNSDTCTLAPAVKAI